MTLSTDSELATNGCWWSGTKGELRALRGFARSGLLIQRIIPAAAETATSQTVRARTFYAHMHAGHPQFLTETDHSKPIDRRVVERFSPTRL